MEYIAVEEPKIVNGQYVYEHGKLYRWYPDKRICKYVDYRDGSGYMEYNTMRWPIVDNMRREQKIHVQLQLVK